MSFREAQAHTLFCEATFVEDDAGQAARTAHLTTRACGEVAEEAGVARLVPFHFSRRYEADPAQVLCGNHGYLLACGGA